MTGIGTALLGSTLPVMLMHWRLSDASAGGLFLLLFVGSSAGSIANRASSMRRVVEAGLLLAATCCALAFSHGRVVYAVTTVYGFGLGMAISSVTRMRLHHAFAARVMEVNRLNLVWGLGAFLCPTISNEILRHADVRILFLAVAGVFAACVAGTFAVAGQPKMQAATERGPEHGGEIRLPWLIAIEAFLAVGLESSLGAWLATYANRLEGGFAAPVEATTLFWLGLLASRAACSTGFLPNVAERRLLLWFMVLAAAGSTVLVSVQRGRWVLGASVLAGFGVGPVFPLLLAAVLPRVRGNLIFVAAGAGSAVLPWITGVISWHAGSLRLGLLTPAVGALLMLALGPQLEAAFNGLQEAAG
ncbi:MAG TPA: MFS transporter [Acidobacteriaceae bacterium]|nr:MFS transporter [Acidobacteriaceae bacterium]